MPPRASPSKPTRRRAAAASTDEDDEHESPVASHPLEPELPAATAATPKSTARSRRGAAQLVSGDKPSGGGGLGRGVVLAVVVALLAAAGGALYTQPAAREQLQSVLQASNKALPSFGGFRDLMARMWLGVSPEFLARMDVPQETLSRLGMTTQQQQPADGVPRKQQQREPRGEVPADGVPRRQQPREPRADAAAEAGDAPGLDGAPRKQQRREVRSTLPEDVEPIPQPVPPLPPLPPITQAEIEAFEQVRCVGGHGVGVTD